jgi:hypothetical protein
MSLMVCLGVFFVLVVGLMGGVAVWYFGGAVNLMVGIVLSFWVAVVLMVGFSWFFGVAVGLGLVGEVGEVGAEDVCLPFNFDGLGDEDDERVASGPGRTT